MLGPLGKYPGPRRAAAHWSDKLSSWGEIVLCFDMNGHANPLMLKAIPLTLGNDFEARSVHFIPG